MNGRVQNEFKALNLASVTLEQIRVATIMNFMSDLKVGVLWGVVSGPGILCQKLGN